MTPQEINEYKSGWLPGHRVRIHSDLDSQAKSWVKENIEDYQMNVKYNAHTNVYEHTFSFKLIEDAKKFKEAFEKWTKM